MASDIEAGKAFIRLLLDDQTREAIKRAQVNLKAYGEMASQISGSVAANTKSVMSSVESAAVSSTQSLSSGIFSAVSKGYSEIDSVVDKTMENVGQSFKLQGQILEAIKPAAEVVVDGVIKAGGETVHLVNAVANVVTAVATAAGTALQFGQAFRFVAATSDQAGVAVDAMGSQGATAFGAVKSQVDALVSAIRDQLAPLISMVSGQFSTLASTIGSRFRLLADAVMMPIRSIMRLIGVINTLNAFPGKIAGAFMSAFMAIPRAVGAAITATVSIAKTGIQSLATAAASASRAAVNAISSAVRSLASAVAGAVRQVASLAVSAVGMLAKVSFNPGRYIVQPLTNALAGGANAVSGFFGSIESGLNAIASRVVAVGGVLAGAAAAVIVPLTAAAKEFGDAGAEADAMARKLGMSVEAAQQLDYAAKQLDISPETVQSASKSAGKYVADQAASGGNGRLEDIGLDAQQLKDLPLEEQFATIGAAIEQIQDPLRQAAVSQEIFGDGAEKLSPLFSNNAEQLRKYGSQAANLGLVMGGPAVASAVALSDAYRFLKDATTGLWRTLGQAVAPAITETTRLMGAAIASVTRWVAANQPLIAKIFQLATTVATVGSVVLTLGGAIGSVASVFGVLAGAAGSVATAITVIGGAAAAVLSPVALLAAAAAGVAVAIGRTAIVQDAASRALRSGVGAWGTVADAAQGAYGTIVDVLGKITAFTTEVFGGVTKAIMAGDLELAVQVAWLGAQIAWASGLSSIADLTDGAMGGIMNALSAGDFSKAFDIAWTEIQILFQQGIGAIQTLWVGLRNTFDQVATYLQQTWNTVLQALAKQTVSMVHGLQNLLGGIAANDPTGLLGGRINDLSNAISKGLASSGLQGLALGNADQKNAGIDEQLRQRQSGRDTELEKQMEANAKAIADLQQVLDQLNEDAKTGAGDQLGDLRGQLADAISRANAATPMFDFSAAAKQARDAADTSTDKTKFASVGTFSADAAVRMQGAFSGPNRQEQLLERIAKAVEKSTVNKGPLTMGHVQEAIDAAARLA